MPNDGNGKPNNGNGKKNGLLLTDFELEVMNNLWSRGKASASRVQMDMIRSGLMYAYPSVYSVLRKFTKTGVCKFHQSGYISTFSPQKTRDQIAEAWIRHLEEKIFGS